MYAAHRGSLDEFSRGVCLVESRLEEEFRALAKRFTLWLDQLAHSLLLCCGGTDRIKISSHLLLVDSLFWFFKCEEEARRCGLQVIEARGTLRENTTLIIYQRKGQQLCLIIVFKDWVTNVDTTSSSSRGINRV